MIESVDSKDDDDDDDDDIRRGDEGVLSSLLHRFVEGIEKIEPLLSSFFT